MILDSLQVTTAELERATGWTLEPEGLCRDDRCVPFPTPRGGVVDVRTVAGRLGMALLADETHGIWALGPEAGGKALASARLPDLVLPDVNGTLFPLSSLHGQKVFLAAWASWCGCRLALPGWQRLRAELHPKGLEVVTVALDLEPEAARPWIEASGAEHPQLIDSAHRLDALLGIVNVPMAVWVDEDGMLVRPAEVCATERSRYRDMDIPEGLPDRRREILEQVRRIPDHHGGYVRALRDWVDHGAESRYAMSATEVVEASASRPMGESEAAAHFDLGQHLHHAGSAEDARLHFREAHRLQPGNWTYKRNAWELVAPGEQGPNEHYDGDWLSDIKVAGAENYYAAPSF
ncbi:MAG: ResA-like WAxxUGC motif-containing protein [Acidimicrobiia bacterium]